MLSLTALRALWTVLRKTNVACCPKTVPPNLDGIKKGTTRLDDLPPVLLRFRTDASDGTFFWARWYKRRSPIGWNTNTNDTNDADYGEWKLVNFLALSDARGVLIHNRVCLESELITCLQQMLAMAPDLPPLDPPRIEFSAAREAITQWGRGAKADSLDELPRFSAARNGDGNRLEILRVVGDRVGVYTRAGYTDGVNKPGVSVRIE